MGRARAHAARQGKFLQGLGPKILDPGIDFRIGAEIMLVVAQRERNEWSSSELEKAAVEFLPHVVVPNVCYVIIVKSSVKRKPCSISESVAYFG